MAHLLTAQERVWVNHGPDGWQAAEVVNRAGGVVTVQLESNRQEIECRDTKKIAQRNPEEMEGLNDLIKLQFLDEPNIIHNLRVRYNEDKIYTYTGPILISINPWKRLPIYGRELLEQYRGKFMSTMPPHVFAVAEFAYKSMIANNKNQSILISGESGAGKTEATKIVMQYMAVVSGSKARGLQTEQRVLETNPLLEAFGNAKTLRNDNSSRFGKYGSIILRTINRSHV